MREDGSWYRFSAGRGGGDMLSLIVELHEGKVSTAHDYAREWLADHPGFGEWEGDSDASRKRDERSAEHAEMLRKKWQPTTGTPSERYLQSRGLVAKDGRDPVGHVLDTVPSKGLGAIVGSLTLLTEPDTWLGMLQLNIDALGTPEMQRDGNKKLKRLYFATADREMRRQAVFRIDPLPLPAPEQASETPPAPPDGTELVGKTIITEGLENTLAVSGAAPFSTVLGIPGISRLTGLGLTGSVVVLRDNDGPDGQATKALVKGIDAQLLDGVGVKITDTPIGRDAADYAKDGDWAGLRSLLVAARPATLSREGEIERLVQLYVTDRLAFGNELSKVAKKFSIKPESLLQKAVEERIVYEEPEDTLQQQLLQQIGGEDLWPEPVTDIAEVCATAAAQLKKYILVHDLDIVTIVMWALFTHFLHHAAIVFTKNPRLVFSAIGSDCGKTLALMCCALMMPRVYTTGIVSGAMLAWLANKVKPSIAHDELDKALRRDEQGEIYQLYLSGHERRFASKGKMTTGDGNEMVGVIMDTWMAIAGTSIGTFHWDSQLDSRTLYISMRMATPAEAVGLVYPADGYCSVLNECRRKMARWAADMTELPEVRGTDLVPRELHNRFGDNWVSLLRVAAAVGDGWPEATLQAALRARARRPQARDWNIDLLRDLRTILMEENDGKGTDRIWSETLVERLNGLDNASRDWRKMYLNTQSVGSMLNAVLQHLEPPQTTLRVRQGALVRWGVYSWQLQELFERHLPPYAKVQDGEASRSAETGLGGGTPHTSATAAADATDGKAETGTASFRAPSLKTQPLQKDTAATDTSGATPAAGSVAAVSSCSGNTFRRVVEKNVDPNSTLASVAAVAAVAGENGPPPPHDKPPHAKHLASGGKPGRRVKPQVVTSRPSKAAPVVLPTSQAAHASLAPSKAGKGNGRGAGRMDVATTEMMREVTNAGRAGQTDPVPGFDEEAL